MLSNKSAYTVIGVTLGLLLFVIAGVSGSPPTERVSVPARAPSYCGTKATERLPECGWTEQTEAKKKQASKYDSCAGASEDQVRKMWVVVKGTQPGTDSTHAALTAELLRKAEDLCREFRDAKPTPLPPELKELVR